MLGIMVWRMARVPIRNRSLLALRPAWRPSTAPKLKPVYRTLPPARNIQYQRFGQKSSSNSRFNRVASFFSHWAAHPHFYYHVAGIGGVVSAVFIYNLETVEVSGRRRFNIVSDAYVQSMATQQERAILQQFKGHVLPDWDARSQRVARVLARLTPHAVGLESSQWSVRVIESDEANAFVLPGNRVFIFTEMLEIAGSDDGIAAVLGHEIGHSVAKHIAEKLSQSIFLGGAAFLSAYLLGFDPGLTQLLMSLAFERPGSRAQEAEADYIGLLMMASACYDPEAAVQLWARMHKVNPAEIPQFLSTHPSHTNREQTIRKWLPEAREKLDSSNCGVTHQAYTQFQDLARWS